MSYTVTYHTGRGEIPDRASITDASGDVVGSVQPDTYGADRWEAWRPRKDGTWEFVDYGDTQEEALASLGFDT